MFYSFRKLREKDISPYHIQLSLSMIFMLIVSFVLIALSVQNSTDPYGGCVTVSVLVHYFTLVSVMWMAAIALFIFQKVMFVFHKITTKFTVGISIICWSKSWTILHFANNGNHIKSAYFSCTFGSGTNSSHC